MKIQIVKISRRSSGGETRQERIVESASCSIGRATDSTLVINDLSVPLRHSSLRLKEDGVHLECDDATEVLVGGIVVESTCLSPGQVVRIANVELRIVEPALDEDLAIEIRDVARRGDARAELALRTRFGVEPPRVGRRGLSWISVVFVVSVFFLRPLLTGSGEAAWNTGPISSAHSFIADDCRVCHSE
ncbi:MAG: FHA domain-containing protein, partial [Myxococcota bacterium]